MRLFGGRADLAKSESLLTRRVCLLFLDRAPARPPEAPPITHMYSCGIPSCRAELGALTWARRKCCLGGFSMGLRLASLIEVEAC